MQCVFPVPLLHRRQCRWCLPITLNNYGGTCGYVLPAWIKPFVAPRTAPSAARATRHVKEEAELGWRPSAIHPSRGRRRLGQPRHPERARYPGAHGSVHLIGQPTPLDHVRRVIVFSSIPCPHRKRTGTSRNPRRERLEILLKASAFPWIITPTRRRNC